MATGVKEIRGIAITPGMTILDVSLVGTLDVMEAAVEVVAEVAEDVEVGQGQVSVLVKIEEVFTPFFSFHQIRITQTDPSQTLRIYNNYLWNLLFT